MAESKYGKYIVTDLKMPEWKKTSADGTGKNKTRVLWLDDEVIKGAMFFTCAWYWTGYDNDSGGAKAHKHDFDEIIGFIGSNQQDVRDLGGEVEFWIEDEKFIIKNSCVIFMPKGLKHCPLMVRKVKRPIYHFSVGNESKYLPGQSPEKRIGLKKN